MPLRSSPSNPLAESNGVVFDFPSSKLSRHHWTKRDVETANVTFRSLAAEAHVVKVLSAIDPPAGVCGSDLPGQGSLE